MTATPLITDIDFTRYDFQPGDRVLCRVAHDLDADQQARICKSVTKFAGEDVRILLLNYKITQLMKVTTAGRAEIICDDIMSSDRRKRLGKGAMELRCCVVDLQPDDLLSVQLKHFPGNALQKERIINWLERWTGPDVEIRLMRWV